MQAAIANLQVPSPVAARFVVACREASDALMQALEDVRGKVPDSEFRQLAQAVGVVAGHEIFDLKTRLTSLHPELDIEDPQQLARMYEGGFDAHS